MAQSPFKVETVPSHAVPKRAARGRVRKPSPFDDVMAPAHEDGEWRKVSYANVSQRDDIKSELQRAGQHANVTVEKFDADGAVWFHVIDKVRKPRNTESNGHAAE